VTVATLIYAKQSRGKVRWVLVGPEDSDTSARKIWPTASSPPNCERHAKLLGRRA